MGSRSAWVKLHEGAIKVTLIERVTLNRDLGKLRGLVMGIFEGRISSQGRVQRQECAKYLRKGPGEGRSGDTGHHEGLTTGHGT